MYKETAPYLVALFTAAKKDGVDLRLNSSWRELEDRCNGEAFKGIYI